MKFILKLMGTIFALFAVLTFFMGFYIVGEKEQAQLRQFGGFVGDPITEAGIKWKIPWVQSALIVPKQTLEWDGAPFVTSTFLKTNIVVDGFAFWRVKDIQTYYRRLTADQRRADARITKIMHSAVSTEIAKYEIDSLIIRDVNSPLAPKDDPTTTDVNEAEIFVGNAIMEDNVLKACQPTFEALGLELIGCRFKRVGYTRDVRQDVVARMVSERKMVAAEILSEGREQAERITGEMERELTTLASGAERRVREIKGTAEGEVKQMYNTVFESQDAMAFYVFNKQLEAAATALRNNGELTITTDSPLFRIFKTLDPKE